MPKASEGQFSEILRSIGSLFSGVANLTGAGLDAAGYSLRQSLRHKQERDQIRALEAHYDTQDLYARNAELARAAGFPDLEGFMEAFYQQFAVAADARDIPEPIYSIRAKILTTAGLLYSGEGLSSALPKPPGAGPIEEARYRDRLLARMRKASSPDTLSLINRTLIDACENYLKALPSLAHDLTEGDESDDPVAPTVPLSDVLPDLGRTVYGVILPFYRTDIIELGLFSDLRAQIEANQAEASKNSKGEVDPETYSGDDVVHAFLKNTLLEELFKVSIPFLIPPEARFSGHWIIAPSGRGKTTLLHSMFLDDLKRDASIIVMDSKGDLIDPIKELAAVKDRLLLIEPDADFAFALNPLDVSRATVIQAITLIEYIMAGLLDAKFTSLQSTLFRNVVPAIIEAMPNPNLETFKGVMVRGLPHDALANVNPHARDFFEDRETGFYSKTYESTRKEVVWRLDYLMTNPVLRSMFSAVQTKLDIGKEMDAGRIIVINNSKAILTDEGAEFFGRFFIALIARAAQQRAGRHSGRKKPCYVYIDECQSVISKDARVPILLDECRSQKIGLILAHQRTAQLSAAVLDAAANCAIRMANSDDEAKYLSDKLRIDTDALRSLPRGTFATFVRDLTPLGLALKVPYTDLSALPKMTATEQQDIRARMREQFSFTPRPTEDSTDAAAPAQTDSSPADLLKPPPAPPPSEPHAGDHSVPATKWGD